MNETVNRQLDDLQQRITHLKASVASAERETAEQVQTRLDRAQADAKSAQEDVADAARRTSDEASSSWTALKQDMKARVGALHERAEARRRQAGATVAEHDAEWCEGNAEDAISFARWAIDNAGVAVLTAVQMRLRADSKAARV